VLELRPEHYISHHAWLLFALQDETLGELRGQALLEYVKERYPGMVNSEDEARREADLGRWERWA
jgi:hypothetical protein